MHNINKKLLGIVLACGLATPLVAQANGAAATTESGALIKGFAQYQAKRVEGLLLDQFVDDLAQRPYFQLFFPQTSRAIGDYSDISGKRLIPLMDYYFNEDLKTVKLLGDCLRRDRGDVGKVNAFSNWVSAFGPPKDGEARKEKKSPEAFLKETYGSAAPDCTTAAATPPSMGTLASALNNPTVTGFTKALYKQLNPEKQADIEAVIKAEGINQPSPPHLTTPSSADLGAIDALVQFADALNGNKDMPDTVRVHHFLSALAALGVGDNDNANFTRFRSGALFLASLREAQKAKDADAVEAAIKAFVQDGDAYQSKRSPSGIIAFRRDEPDLVCKWGVVCGNNWFIGSYFGAAVDYVDDGSGQREWRGRAFGPVGLELKLFDANGFPISLNAAPYDLGGYITSELRGDAYDARLEDIKAPSYFLAFSGRNRPFAVLLGYQEDVQTAPGRREDVGFVSFAFDLPLLRLH